MVVRVVSLQQARFRGTDRRLNYLDEKILTIAAREYKAMVGTKAFVISIIMMPVLMLGSLVVMELLRNTGEIQDRVIGVIDHSGDFLPAIEAAAQQRSQALTEARNRGSDGDRSSISQRSEDNYIFESIDPETIDDERRLALSDRIRNQELYAFVEIPVLNDTDPSQHASIRFYAQDASLSDAKNWLAQIINAQIRNQRLQAANIDPAIVAQASQRVNVVGMGLVERNVDGSVESKEDDNPMTAIFLPMGVMMLMFMVIFMASQPMLESVLEEKSQRIAEVLLGSANSFQLMSGKLLGTVGGSLTVFGIYLAGMYGFAAYKGYLDQIPFELAPWFVLFQILGVLFYASIFLAIGASVSQLKEAQSMLLPVWMLMMSPMFVWLMLVRNPLDSMATWFSLFPPATPTAMMLRLATGQTIPTWQPILGAVLTAICTMVIVYVAARIFRVGILWQGKSPKFHEILMWAFRG